MSQSTHWHILIIDDNPDDRAAFRQMLIAGSGRTCHFSEAELGGTGLQMVLDNQAQSLSGTGPQFDCVLLDFHLPDINATQWLPTLCGDSGIPPCPVVVMTGWDGVDGTDGPKVLQAGAQDYIGKSWTTAESLCRAIENSIDRFKLLQTRDQARHALTHTEERYRTLFNSIDEGYCIIDMIFDAQDHPLDYRFIEISQSFEAQTGLTDALGKTILELIPGIETKWLQIYGGVALTGESIRVEDYVEHMNRWFDVYAFRFGNPANRQLGVLFTDSTRRKAVETQLRDAMTAAQTANRAKSTFLSNMSHELRTPLNAILGFAQLMEATTPAPTPAHQQSLAHIVKAGWYLLELVNHTLDLAAIEAGKLSFSLGTVPLDNVLQECAAIIAPLATKRALSVNYPPPDPAHLAHADPIRVKQVLLNLLSNSVKYNREGGNITVVCSAVAGQRLHVSVQDTGQGISPEQLTQLFEPYNRLGQEKTTAVGTGIGLVLCKRLVELMDGHIGVESTPGQGSNFWFELPLASANETMATSMQTLTPVDELGSVLLNELLGPMVLHVEDNPANLELVAQLLAQRPQHRLLSATHGGLGVELARAHLPAVILMDISLPDISGTEILKLLQADPATAHIPVIALSANALPHEIESGLEAGFFRYVTKPIRVREFFEGLDEALLFSKQSESTSASKAPQ
ncbi:MAG: response regulator [Pseudohongiella sp.]|nr:response regulator [Pseudohongiella sp.]